MERQHEKNKSAVRPAASSVESTPTIQAKSIAPPPLRLTTTLVQKKQAASSPKSDLNHQVQGESANSNTQHLQSKSNDNLNIDTIQRSFGDTNHKEQTATGFEINRPTFDPDKMGKELPELKIKGSGEAELKDAMLALYKNPQGEDLQKALAIVAKVRGMDIKTAQAQYEKAQQIRVKGREYAMEKAKKEGKEYTDVSPDLDLEKHGGFTGSLSQLRFGSILGDFFGIDPVFGALISPTGGLVGPGNKSVQMSDNNPIALHGTVHDAAGYMLNAHGAGPGYNYLKKDWELPTTNPYSGQVSGIAYWLKEGVKRVASNIWNKAKGVVENAANWVVDKAKQGWNWTKDKAKQGANWVTDKVKQGANWVADKAKQAWNWTKQTAQKTKAWGKSVAQKAMNGAKNAIQNLVNGAKSVGKTISQGASTIAQNIKQTATNAWEATTNTVSSAWDGAKNKAESAWNKVKSWF